MHLIEILHTKVDGDGLGWGENTLSMLESSEYQMPTTRRAKPILIQTVNFSVAEELEAALPDINGRPVLQEGHSSSNRKGCKGTARAESHRKREQARRGATNKELDRLGRLFPVMPGKKLQKARVLLYSK